MFVLRWQPPYDWAWMWRFLAARAVAGVEAFHGGVYSRSFALDGYRGVIAMQPDEASRMLRVTLTPGLLPAAEPCLARVRRLLDLQRDPHDVARALGPLAQARPGLRLPGSLDPFEQGVRAILGQLVSVAMAAKLTAKVAAAYGEPLAEAGEYVCFPGPARIAAADPQHLRALGMPLRRAEALIFLARAALAGELQPPADIDAGIRRLQTFPGIGRWTANYFALRGWQAQDVFLADDYLIKQRFAGMTPAQIGRYAGRWRPWRSYALLHIWYADDFAPLS